MNNTTGGKQADKKLEQQSEAMEAAIDGMAILDRNQEYIYVNRTHCEIYGYLADELIGKTWRMLYSSAEVQRFEKEIMPRLMESGLYQGNASGKRKDGSFFPQEISLKILKAGGMICVVRDITEMVRAEKEKKELMERLFHSNKMEAIGTLAGGIAHDFNNILKVIQGSAALALMETPTSHPNHTRLQQIGEQVMRGADLTRRLLKFTRGEQYDVTSIDMNNALEEIVFTFSRIQKGVTIHRKYKKGIWSAEVDSMQIEQVFMNLFINAWQAIQEKGAIYVETDNVVLNEETAALYLARPGRYVKISVTDTGMGMDKSTMRRIFIPFFTTKSPGKGTGLGLATVYGIVKGHLGAINVCSEIGHGTTFTVYLPALGERMVSEKDVPKIITMGTEVILLVDDEETTLKTNKEILAYMGYEIYTASGGQEAIDIYLEKKEEIDLVILDLVMPNISGREVFNRLQEINPAIKVLILSGYNRNEEVKAMIEQGCKGFIQKPMRIITLSHKIREVLGT